MKQNISLKFKLIGLTMGLVVIPIAITSAVFLNELGQVIQMALEEAEKGITNQVKQTFKMASQRRKARWKMSCIRGKKPCC